MNIKYYLLVSAQLWALPMVAQTVVDTAYAHTRTLREVFVSGSSPQADNLDATQLGVATFDAAAIQSTPVILGEPDVLKVLQTQAGVSGGTEGLAGLYVHGGENDQNLFLLHHLPLHGAYHLGGLFSAFNPSVVEKVQFFKSAFPARYGGKVSSVTAITMPDGDYDAFHGQASVGLTSGNVFLTGPLVRDRLSFSVGLRRSWFDLLTVPALMVLNHQKKSEGKKTIAGYAFSDVNLKLDYRLSGTLTGYTHFYRGNDRLKWGAERFSPTGDEDFREQNVMRADWGNTGAATGLTLHPFEGLLLSANAYYVHYAAQFRQERDDWAGDVLTYSHKAEQNGMDDLGLSLLLDNQPLEVFSYRVGADLARHEYRPGTQHVEGNVAQLVLKDLPRVGANDLSLWADGTVTPFGWLQLNAGARGVYYASEGRSHARLEPRASLRLSLGRRFSVKAGYARMHQFAQQPSNNHVSLPTDGWLPIGNRWAPLQSDQLSAGVYGSLSEGLYFSVEGYYKWMRHLLDYRDDYDMFADSRDWAAQLADGRGTVYGVDASLHKDVGRLTGTLCYGLLWNDRQFDAINGGRQFPARYDNRHKLNLNAAYQWTDHVVLNVGWTYMTGSRQSLSLDNYMGVGMAGIPEDLAPTGFDENWSWGINAAASRNNVRLPAYHRLDVAVNIHHRFPSGHERIWSFGLYNAYCRMNAVSIQKSGLFNIMPGQHAPWNNRFQTLGILPVLPSVSYTFKF